MTVGPDLHHRGRGMDIRQVIMGRVQVTLREMVIEVGTDHPSRGVMRTLVIAQSRRLPMATGQIHRNLIHVAGRSTEISTSLIVEDIVHRRHSQAVVVASRMASLGVRL